MNEEELQNIIKENSSNFEIMVENKSFVVNDIKIFHTDNPVTKPTTRGGVYFAKMKELKIQATILDTTISKNLSKTMLGPNKDFLDIILKAEIKNIGTVLLKTNLTNSMQNASKVVLYLTLKDATTKSQ